MKNRVITVMVSLAAASMLTACSFSASANLTASPESIEKEVAKSLQREVNGETLIPNIDCGEEHIDLIEGETITCGLSVEGDTAIYDTEVVVTSVEGTNYSLDIQVADGPRE